MKRCYGLGGVAAGLSVGLLSSLAWSATWPIWRGSKERTAAVSGAFADGPPAVAFHLPLGGEATRSVAFPPDMPGKMLTAVGGRVERVDVVTGARDWQSPMLQELSLVGSADLDGDGRSEVVAFTRRQAFAFSGDDGSLVWQSVLGEHSTVAAVRLADVSGDGLPEVLIDDCATCGVPGPLVGEVVTFETSETGELRGRTAWTVKASDVPYPYHQGTDAVLLGLGDGRPLLGLPTLEDYRLVDGLTGAATVIIPRGTHWFAQTSAMVANASQVLVLRAVGNAKGALPPALMSLGVSPEQGQGGVEWEYAGDVYSTLDLSESGVADVDADGRVEVVLNERDRNGEWSVVLLDAVTGSVLSRWPGFKLEGTLSKAAADSSVALVVSSEAGLGVARFQNGEFTVIGVPLPGWEATSTPATDSLVVAPIRPALAQTDSGEHTDLLVGELPEEHANAGGRYTALGWARVTDGGLVLDATHAPKHPITALYAADGATRPYAQVAIATTDGAITVLDRRLRPSNGSLYRSSGCFWDEADETTYDGVVVGGKQPGRANLISRAGAQPFIVVPNTAAGTVVADARTASLIEPPRPLWLSDGLTRPSVFETDRGTVVAGVNEQHLELRDAANGSVVASAPLDQSALGPLGSPHNEPLLLASDEGSPVVALDWALPATQIAQRGFAWTQEGISEVWTSEPMSWGGGFFSSAGRYRFDAGVPTTDVLVMATNGTTFYRRADTGQSVSKTVYTGHYTLPMFSDFTGDGETDILFQAGFVSPYLYGPNWTPLWQKPGPLPTYTMAGALIPCESGARYATPYLRSSRFLVHDARTGEVILDAVAASGALFASEAAALGAGAMPGFLSNMSVIDAPDADESLVLFGSTDGHLYAVNGCGSLELAWALDAGTPLGEPSIGDWDGDGQEELLVGAASGHVMGIDFGRLAAPIVNVDRVSRHSASLSWSAIEGATRYEYALVEPDGTPVWDPPYRRARGTHARVDLQQNLAGRPFRVAVRAITSETQGNVAFSTPLSLTDTRSPRVHAEWSPRGGVWFGAADDSALDHYLLWAVDAAGERTLLEDGFLSGQFTQRHFHERSLSPAPDAVASSVVVTVVDAAGNRTEREVERPLPSRRGHRKHGHRR